MRIIFMVILGFSIIHADLIKEGNIVKDDNTALEWQDDTQMLSLSWEESLDMCENLTLGEHSDWRVPNLNELKSIVDRLTIYPAISTEFENSDNEKYWSSTTYEGDKLLAWGVNFYNGSTVFVNKKTSLNIRCVRAGK